MKSKSKHGGGHGYRIVKKLKHKNRTFSSRLVIILPML